MAYAVLFEELFKSVWCPLSRVFILRNVWLVCFFPTQWHQKRSPGSKSEFATTLPPCVSVSVSSAELCTNLTENPFQFRFKLDRTLLYLVTIFSGPTPSPFCCCCCFALEFLSLLLIFYQAVWWWIRPSVLDGSCSLHPVLFPEPPAQRICPRRPNSSWGSPEHPWQPPGHLPWHPVWKLLLPGISCWHTHGRGYYSFRTKNALSPCINNLKIHT